MGIEKLRVTKFDINYSNKLSHLSHFWKVVVNQNFKMLVL